MKPAERIPLLKKLASGLSDDGMSWEEMGLVLRQFGFTSESLDYYDEDGNLRSPGQYGFALHHVETSGTDEARLELERYLNPGEAANGSNSPTSVGPGPWEDENTVRLFISHTHPNATFAAEMKEYLGRYLIESFVAHADIKPSAKWIRIIESALFTCHAAVALLTPDFRKSQWCDQEVGFLLARSLLVVPLIRDNAPHGFLSEIQGMKLNKQMHAMPAARSVFRTLAERTETRDRMVPSIVRRFSASGSYDNTREAFTLLARIPKDAWTQEMVNEVEAACEKNSQVKDANLRTGTPVPVAIEKLLEPMRTRLVLERWGLDPTAAAGRSGARA
jgi:hypothetical protein